VRHLAYGVVIESDVALGVPASTGPVNVTVKQLRQPIDSGSITWLDRGWDTWMSAGLVGGSFYLRFDEEAEFLVAADGRSLRWYSFEEVSDTLVHLVLDHVLPRALMRLDRIVLHGSCVARHERGCVAILGRSGSGKSTLAAALVAKGYSLIADDCVVIQREDGVFLVTAAYPGLRLTNSSVRLSGINGFEVRGAVSRHSPKRRMAPRGGDDSPPAARHRLLAVIALRDLDDHKPDAMTASCRKLAPSAAGIELLRHSFHLNGPGERGALLGRVLPVAGACPVFQMFYDHSDVGLELAAREIESVLSSCVTREVGR
jgi:HPr serine kinase-like protein